jgi:hypothetical protein
MRILRTYFFFFFFFFPRQNVRDVFAKAFSPKYPELTGEKIAAKALNLIAECPPNAQRIVGKTLLATYRDIA